MSSDSLRFVITMLPLISLLILLRFGQYEKRILTSTFLSLLWNFSTLYIINMVAVSLGWWSFSTTDPLWLGLPPDVIFGWAIYWGPLFYLIGKRIPIFFLCVIALWLDLIFMPRSEPLILLEENWIIGDLITLCFVFMPGLWLARSTEQDRNVVTRGFMQAIVTAILLFFILPAGILELTDKSWSVFLNESAIIQSLYFNLILPALVIGLSANFEFSRVGSGTPIPFDPPKKIVSTGIYSYLANPMQVSMVWIFICMAFYYKSFALLGAALMSVIYSVGFVAWYNQNNIQQQWPQQWPEYKRNVKNWLPGWKPWVAQPATLYLSHACGICRDLERYLLKFDTTGIQIIDATEYPGEIIDRITYIRNGNEEKGILAIARYLEHVNLLFAFLGFFMRLPIISNFLQVIIDTSMVQGEAVRPKRYNNTK